MRRPRALSFFWLVVVTVTSVACKEESSRSRSVTAGGRRIDASLSVQDASPEATRGTSPINDPVWRRSQGEWKKVSKKTARRKGQFILDLSDEWAPFIFSESTPGDPVKKTNAYRKIYIGLANEIGRAHV